MRTAETDLEMKIVADKELDEAQKEKLTQVIHERFQYPFRVTFTYHDEIPRGPGGKFEDFRSEVD